MIKTKKATRKKIDELKMDLEIINPIESKTLLGGGDIYSMDGGTLETITIGNQWWHQLGGNPNFGYNTGTSNYYHNGGEDYGNGGGGGSGEGNSNNSTNTVDCTINGLPSSVEQQATNAMCTYYSYLFASHVLGSSGTTINTIATTLSSNPNIGSLGYAIGLSPFQNSIAINNLFNCTFVQNIAQIQTALCNNQPTIANFNGHEITIVGCNSTDNTFYVADSQWASNGGYHHISAGEINMANAYIVTGVKP